MLAAADQDGSVRLWDVRHARRPVQLGRPLRHEGYAVDTVAFSPDDEILASGGADQSVTLWNIEHPNNVKKLGTPFAHTDKILSLAFSPDGAILAVGDGDGDIVLWDMKTRRSLGDSGLTGRHGANSEVDALRFDRRGSVLLSAGPSNPIVAWKSTLWSDDADILREYACRFARRNLRPDEWAQLFADTRLEHRGDRRTCPTYPVD
jgi:WD40 repeat protein